MTRAFLVTGAALLLIGVGGTGATDNGHGPRSGPMTRVVVTLRSPPLAYATPEHRRAAGERVRREQAAFLARARGARLGATVRWRYRLVANGLALTLPVSSVSHLRRLPGMHRVYDNVRYGITSVGTAAPNVTRIGAPALWGAALESAGQGMKIGIIDDGVDQTSPYFDPAGYTMPAGFPKGQVAYTTSKVIVARAFPPPSPTYANAAKPFDAGRSSHGTHVAGIAAGNADTPARGQRISGVAPRAYIGNYKALTVPTDADVGLDGNAPELIAAVEAAVADGMDVINLSLGQPEIEPTRDLLARALDAAAAAGVVPVVAAGNDYESFGRGSLISPGSSAAAITVAAASVGQGAQPDTVAGFSSAGPTSVSLRLKPDVTAPGVGILSATPGGFGFLSGTSMATPHVAGAAALLRQRHPGWTVSQLKAALVATGRPARLATGAPGIPTRVGGGTVDLTAADTPLVLPSPSSVSFGLVRPADRAAAQVSVVDAGGGAGAWEVSIDRRQGTAGATVTIGTSTLTVPGTLTLSAATTPATSEGEVSGYVVLTRGEARRRIPFWLRVEAPRLANAAVTPLVRPGVHKGDTRGRRSLATTYRYPEVPEGGVVTARLAGPEQVFRVTLRRPAANFGVVITRRGRGVAVEPRVVVAGDENRLVGHTALPLNLNPYLAGFLDPVLAAGAVRPNAGSFDVVFDSRTPAGAGSFTFRYWLDDVTPPTVKLLTRAVRRGTPLRARVADAGAGIDPATVVARIDATARGARLRKGVLQIATGGLQPGRHALRLQVSDYQETRNMESSGGILPNTRVLSATITVEG